MAFIEEVIYEVNSGSNAAAAAAAAAAFFSAVAALLILHTQRVALRESVRPELVAADWSRTSPSEAADTVILGSVINVGKGNALHLAGYVVEETSGAATLWMGGQLALDIIPSAATRSVQLRIPCVWSTDAVGHRDVRRLTLCLFYWDALGNRYKVLYRLSVRRDQSLGTVGEHQLAVAQGVIIIGRDVTVMSPWMRSAESILMKIPIVGDWLRERRKSTSWRPLTRR